MTARGDEVAAYLGRGRYERGDGFRGYRNGSSSRRLTLGRGTVALETPRVRDIPPAKPRGSTWLVVQIPAAQKHYVPSDKKRSRVTCQLLAAGLPNDKESHRNCYVFYCVIELDLHNGTSR